MHTMVASSEQLQIRLRYTIEKLSPNEILALSALISMETQGLALAKASINAMGDEKLRDMTEAGIMRQKQEFRECSS